MNHNIDRMANTLRQRFKDNFNALGYNFEDDIQNWSYAGGDARQHENYFKLLEREDNLERPEIKSNCLCGQAITNQCYIRRNNELLVVGSCCIEKFTENGVKRTCDSCGDPHRNRVVNRCNDCRLGICDECNRPCQIGRKICFKCYNLSDMECCDCGELFRGNLDDQYCSDCIKIHCKECGESKPNNKYKKCYDCNKNTPKHNCNNCGKLCNQKFMHCWNCNQLLNSQAF